jgi:hypothetical protein
MFLRFSNVLMCWLVCFFAAYGQATRAENDIPKLLEQVMKNQRVMNNRLTEYTSTSKQITRWFDEKGKLKEETTWVSESYQSLKRNVEVIISKNGKPLSASKIEKERAQAVKALTEDEKARLQAAATAQALGPALGFTYRADEKHEIRLSVFDFFRAAEFFNFRQEQLNGREMILLDFRPRADFQAKESRLVPLGQLAGTVWIDVVDKVPTKLDAYLSSDQARKTVAFQFENIRQPDGVWLLGAIRLNAAISPATFNGLNLEYVLEKSNYQRFSAQAGELKLTSPK